MKIWTNLSDPIDEMHELESVNVYGASASESLDNFVLPIRRFVRSVRMPLIGSG